MLLSVDWDAFSGTRELVFDAPIWGTRDREEDRLAAWTARAQRRGGEGDPAAPWAALDADFPLYPGWAALRAYAGVPTWLTLSHADAWAWLERFPGHAVLNLDSHHDLASFSGDPARVRPGNWAGLGLRSGLIRQVNTLYPHWHAGLPVAEGFDLARTWTEVSPLLPADLHGRVTLTRQAAPGAGLPDPAEVRALLLVQSPAWTSPAHDPALRELAGALRAQVLVPPLWRS
ncbi:arginase [Deinococcus multiflagellatus]|uniref:arginase n=1 Tax=Deinococcus multiflagellatus TaxID=1656887 RepID=UPI001CCA1D40|nr:arginase [Deinococcus multiflagellatus]MBZ9713935.1 arginase [Deinococcus multiflagellatus]